MKRHLEKFVAVASFLAAVCFAFTALIIDENHEMAAGNCTVIAQFLLLTASIFGIDYKLNSAHFPFTNNQQDNGNKRC